jgi:hypothetical protein
MGPYVVADQPAAPPERTGIADRLRGLLSSRPSMPSLPGARGDVPPGREEV